MVRSGLAENEVALPLARINGGKPKLPPLLENLLCQLVDRRFDRVATGFGCMMGEVVLVDQAPSSDEKTTAGCASTPAAKPRLYLRDMDHPAVGTLPEDEFRTRS